MLNRLVEAQSPKVLLERGSDHSSVSELRFCPIPSYHMEAHMLCALLGSICLMVRLGSCTKGTVRQGHCCSSCSIPAFCDSCAFLFAHLAAWHAAACAPAPAYQLPVVFGIACWPLGQLQCSARSSKLSCTAHDAIGSTVYAAWQFLSRAYCTWQAWLSGSGSCTSCSIMPSLIRSSMSS